MLHLFLSRLFVGWNVLTWNLASGRFGVLESQAMPYCCEDGAEPGGPACVRAGSEASARAHFHKWCGSLREREAPRRHALLGSPSIVRFPKEPSFFSLSPSSLVVPHHCSTYLSFLCSEEQ